MLNQQYRFNVDDVISISWSKLKNSESMYELNIKLMNKILILEIFMPSYEKYLSFADTWDKQFNFMLDL